MLYHKEGIIISWLGLAHVVISLHMGLGYCSLCFCIGLLVFWDRSVLFIA